MDKELFKKLTKKISKPDLICEMLDYSIVYASEKTEKLLGYTKEELLEMSLLDLTVGGKNQIAKYIAKFMMRYTKTAQGIFKTKSGKKVLVKAGCDYVSHKNENYIVNNIISYKIIK